MSESNGVKWLDERPREENPTLPGGIAAILLNLVPPKSVLVSRPGGQPYAVDTNRSRRLQAADELLTLFNTEMVDFLRILKSVAGLPPEEFKAHVLKAVEDSEKILGDMEVEL